VLALVLALVGVYGVVNVSLRQRHHELGVRRALGAETADIERLLLGEGVWLAVTGVIFGLPGAWVVARLLSRVLFNVQPFDPILWIGAPLLLGLIAVSASVVPARKAARVDVVEALRVE